MSYRDYIKADTREDALERAQKYAAGIDFMRQPKVHAPYEEKQADGTTKWVAVIHYYGLD
jgi:hypothetical protein